MGAHARGSQVHSHGWHTAQIFMMAGGLKQQLWGLIAIALGHIKKTVTWTKNCQV